MSLSIPNSQDPLIIPTVSSTQEGTITPEQLAALTTVGTIATPPSYITVYIRSNGNDTTGKGTLELPYLTRGRAAQDCPQNLNGRSFRIDMTGYGTYTAPANDAMPTANGSLVNLEEYETVDTNLFGAYYASDVEIYAAPTQLLHLAPNTYTVSDDGTAAQLSIITVPGASWTANQYQGCIFAIPSYLTCARVISSTTDTLFVTYTNVEFYGIDPTDTDLYVLQNSCTVDLTMAGWWFGSAAGSNNNITSCNYSLTVAGIAFMNPSSAVDVGLLCPVMTVIGCKGYSTSFGQSSSYGLTSYGNLICLGTDFLGDAHDEGGTFGYISTSCWSLYLKNCTTAYLGVTANDGGTMTMYMCWGVGGDSWGEGNYHSQGYEESWAPRRVGIFFSNHNNTGRGGTRLVSSGGELTVGYCDFTNCGYGGICLQWGPRAHITGPISGTGNGANLDGAGVNVLDDSQLFIASSSSGIPVLNASNITISGTICQLNVNNLPPITWTQFFEWGLYSDLLVTSARAFWGGGILKKASIFNPTAYLIANYAAKDYDFILANPTAAGFTITFPPAALANEIKIRNTTSSTNALTLTPHSGDTISDATLSGSGVYATFNSDGVSAWYRTS